MGKLYGPTHTDDMLEIIGRYASEVLSKAGCLDYEKPLARLIQNRRESAAYLLEED